ncbi:MAG: 50S ribosomal protein L23 [Planctomycetes bacterium]|jgi:large subunit ribosomal protein L23|nr:50S ribosomal protein L23 [Planctomycetota bacterium]
MPNPVLYYGVIQKPLVTEKSTILQDIRNQYSFRVDPAANKREIKKAIETLFDVKVEGVNVLNVPGKFRRTLGRFGKSRDWKKAIVTLRAGDRIEIV